MSVEFICSDCFTDFGLKEEARRIGFFDNRECQNCKKTTGAKLTLEKARDLAVEYFWNGSWYRADFGGAHRIISNEHHLGKRGVQFPVWLSEDADLIQKFIGEGFFHYGPPLWRIGEIEPLNRLRSFWSRKIAARDIIKEFPTRKLHQGTRLFRIRKNILPPFEEQVKQYDTAPYRRGQCGRMDTHRTRVFYASEDLDTCIHECRIAITDECFVAILNVKRDLNLLDLAAEIDEVGTPFESTGMAMKFLFTSDSKGYKYTREIADAARMAGFDGIWYPSFFNLVRDGDSPNVGIFGSPILAKDIEVVGINRATLKSASYKIRFGPLFD
ncbi:MAG: hypothetical protein JWR51_2108 [Devosia sp.]|uniref:RES family NAD+ phosphorylase n=1 Tax=Devosia sp. TaxID=1871048 RepID=UPI002638DFFF|nr:RES family NAD+ phosphorylase [Devosia sp.]MDB5529005.1 hypothetical protein [Devosia sp.]